MKLQEQSAKQEIVRSLSRVVKPSFKAVKNLVSKPKPKPSDYARMYHGTTEKAMLKIF